MRTDGVQAGRRLRECLHSAFCMRLLVMLCSLLVVLPVSSFRSMSVRMLAEITEESRPQSEHECETEAVANERASQRRIDEPHPYLLLSVNSAARDRSRGVSVNSSSGLIAPEHGMRNGLGGPLRC